MGTIWDAADAGDVGEVKRLVGQDPGLLDAKNGRGWTPLISASARGRVEAVRWLVDQGAAINEGDNDGCTALLEACREGRLPVVKVLLEKGADPTITMSSGSFPLMIASSLGHLQVVRLLLGHPSANTMINHRTSGGGTTLWWACYNGSGFCVEALLESGADPTIADDDGITPMAIAKQYVDGECNDDGEISAEGRRECVAALEVRFHLPLSLPEHLLF
jgi:ankyrin repeat protein